jgi:hypothetical protein
MAKHDTDPVLRQLVRAVNESENATVPLTVTVHGTQLTGVLLGERLYFGELIRQNPLMTALEPSSGLLGKEYVKDAEAESGHRLHIRQGPVRAPPEQPLTVPASLTPPPAPAQLFFDPGPRQV